MQAEEILSFLAHVTEVPKVTGQAGPWWMNGVVFVIEKTGT